MEAAYGGREVAQILDKGRTYPLVVRYSDDQRSDVEAIRNTLLGTPAGGMVPLKMLADVHEDAGPNTITRENVQRKMVVMANVAGRDLGGVIREIRAGVDGRVKLPSGYHVSYGGQFESEQAATQRLGFLGVLVIAGIFVLLYVAFRSGRNAALVMLNLPLALVGGVAAVLAGDGILSVAALVGFMNLFGIATRNGIMMISHFEHLRSVEGGPSTRRSSAGPWNVSPRS